MLKDRMGVTETILARHELYRTAFKYSALANLVMAACLLAAVAFAWKGWTARPEPRYFATREDGGIIPLVAISNPFLNPGQVTNFAVEAVTHSFSTDFANWRDDMSEASEYFQRPEGWQSFLAALQSSGMLDFIRENRVVSSAVANGAVIIEDGIDARGRYSWTVQVPLTVTYESASQRTSQSLLAEVVVARLPTWESPAAVGITRVNIR